MKLRTRLALLYAVPFVATGVLLLGALAGTGRVTMTAPVGPQPAHREVERHTANLTVLVIVVLAVLLVCALVPGWLVAGRFTRPLRAITSTARDISASSLHRRLGLSGRGDEFGELAATLDDLFGRLEASFESQRAFVANASHELRTPLTAERTLLQVALADPDASAADLRAACEQVLALGEQQERLIAALLTLAVGQRGPDAREPLDLADVAAKVLRDRGAHAVTALAPAPVSGDPALVESMIANLVDNALRYNVPGGLVEVHTGERSLCVRNTGPMIPPDQVDRLFQPFQRLSGERFGEGHGLGLAIVAAIAGSHDAALTARALPAGGLEVRVAF